MDLASSQSNPFNEWNQFTSVDADTVRYLLDKIKYVTLEVAIHGI